MKNVKRPYNKWSQSSLNVVFKFINQNDDDINKLQQNLKICDGIKRTISSICWQVAKQRMIMGLEPKYTKNNINF